MDLWTVVHTLWVGKGVLDLFPSEVPVLQTSLVLSDSLDHQLLVFLGPALSAHDRVRQPEEYEDGPQDCDDSVAHEESLPRLDWRAGGYV